MLCFRRYRDKERTETDRTSTTPRATTPSEKKPTINVTVNPKSLATTTTNVPSTTKPVTVKPTKKIDMGAATNFGRDEIGINSPTHRNTHAEEDLFGSAIISASTDNQNDLLDDIFKTCSTTNNLATEPVALTTKPADDDFFNPRLDEAQEFGDFASAFGGNPVQTSPPPPSSVTVIDSNIDTKKNDFADFSAAFEPAAPSPAVPTPPATTQLSSNTNLNASANLLFAVNSTPTSAQQTSTGNQNVGDLLSDLDGLSLDVSVPTGKFIHFYLFYSHGKKKILLKKNLFFFFLQIF